MMRKVIAIAIAVFLLLAFLWLSWIEGVYDNAVLENENVQSRIEPNKLEAQGVYRHFNLFDGSLGLSSRG